MALSGCAGSGASQAEGLSVDRAAIAQNTETIEKILSENAWSYDKETMNFGSEPIISDRNEDFDRICAASESAGIDTARLEKGAEQTMTAEVTLRNADMSEAGTAYFVFDNRELLCGYYEYNGGYYSLDNKLPFEYDHPFAVSENKEKPAAFSTEKENPLFEDAAYIGGEAAVISGSALVFYDSTKNGHKRTGETDFGDLAPGDAEPCGGSICVLLDSYEKAEILSESNYEEYDEENEIVRTKSEKIVFVDKDGEYIKPELKLDLSVYTSAALEGDMVAAARNNAIDLFALENGAWVKKQRLSVDGAVEKLRIADLDGDGTAEYVVSDGVNICVYKRDIQLRAAWSTKFTNSKIKDFYVGDMNGDGVKEIYVNELYSDNSSGFALRYVLGENGFEVNGGNVVSGASAYYAVGDLNNDGKDDCLVVNDEEITVYYGQ